MIQEVLPLVTAIATKLKRRLPEHVELGDLVASGMQGAMEAARGFDQDRGVEFGAFARTRIHFAMIDSLRDTDTVSRSERRHIKQGDMVEPRIRSLDKALVDVDHPQFEDRRAADPLEAASWSELQDRCEEIIRRNAARTPWGGKPQPGRAKREILIFRMYFLERRRLHQIGKVVGISESRACQIVNAIRRELKQELNREGRNRA